MDDYLEVEIKSWFSRIGTWSTKWGL